MAGNKETFFVQIKVDVRDEEQIKRLIADMQRFTKTLPKEPFKPFRKGMKQTQIEARKFGRGLQNASYQVQDMIVQIGGGVDPLRSMSQQLPQLLINMGALGAVIGVVAAGLPLLIQAMIDADGETKSFTESIDLLNSSISELGSLDSQADFTSWIKAWNSASEAVRTSKLAILQFQVANAESNLQLAQSSLALEAVARDTITWGTRLRVLGGVLVEGLNLEAVGVLVDEITASFKGGMTAIDGYVKLSGGLNDQLERNAKAYGLNIKQYQYFQKLQKNAADLTQAEVDVLVMWAAGINNTNAAFREQINLIIQLQQARAKLAAGGDLAGQASGGGDIAVPAKPGEIAKQQAAAYKELYDAYKLVNPESVKFFEETKQLNVALNAGYITLGEYEARTEQLGMTYEQLAEQGEIQRQMSEKITTSNNKLAESYDPLAEGLSLFENNFNTMLDGVLMGTQSISEGFKDMARVVVAQLLKIAAQQAIMSFFPGLNLTGAAQGAVMDGGSMTAFAKGGVVSSPTVFPMARGGIGLMGEAGPEAVMPLTRLPNGNLGVESGGGMNVTINNLAPGVDVRTSQGDNGLTIDVVMATIANAVQRGGNNVADAMEQSYSLNRGRAVY